MKRVIKEQIIFLKGLLRIFLYIFSCIPIMCIVAIWYLGVINTVVELDTPKERNTIVITKEPIKLKSGETGYQFCIDPSQSILTDSKIIFIDIEKTFELLR
ncbi:hypothetical protein [Breznakia pachnodae]|uniref:ABC-type amino acid transport system permease subunit n=1 Tax=Breznakia pachnodae TaxID=265178 RepID=A0ABU0DZE8_9FIRM|nr:hypothetical protein [Breznakia pachnodae]MDQ0360009.1 ABC-type amino acid transport system permease subunit [Breznakia pachnodae]